MILVFGCSGQVARELALQAPQARCLSRHDADLADPPACAAAVDLHMPRAVINAAAFTSVDGAEDQEGLATTINGEAPAAMAEVCARRGIPFVHLSTDYVLDGGGNAPFSSEHPPAPVNAYGRSKLRGEEAVRAAGGVHAILRTSWVFSVHGSNFVKTMLRLGAERGSLRVVGDQVGGPTPARAIAEACLRVALELEVAPAKTGTYHFCGSPDVSWADFARAIMSQAGLPCRIDEIPSADYPTRARRPLNSRLDCRSLRAFGLKQPDWREELKRVVDELQGYDS